MVKRDLLLNNTNHHKRYSLRLPSEGDDEIRPLRPFRMPWVNEKELLRRMSGRRRQRSSTVGDGLDRDNDSYSESDFTEDEKETCFYRPFGRSSMRSRDNNRFNEQRSASVKDLSSRSQVYRSPPDTSMFYTSKAMKRLSVKPELDEDEDGGNISDNSSTSSFSSYSSFSTSPQLPLRSTTRSSVRQRDAQLRHAQSVDNLILGSSSTPRRMSRPLTKMKSCEDILGNLSSSSTTSLASNLSRRTSVKGATPSANLMSMRNTLMTSSYRNLADRNVRENPAVVEPTKTLRTSSPYLERRLAEARERNSKREAKMRELDNDFNKAKEIINKYKSTENLLIKP